MQFVLLFDLRSYDNRMQNFSLPIYLLSKSFLKPSENQVKDNGRLITSGKCSQNSIVRLLKIAVVLAVFYSLLFSAILQVLEYAFSMQRIHFGSFHDGQSQPFAVLLVMYKVYLFIFKIDKSWVSDGRQIFSEPKWLLQVTSLQRCAYWRKFPSLCTV